MCHIKGILTKANPRMILFEENLIDRIDKTSNSNGYKPTNDFDNVIKKIILIKVRNFFYQHKAIKEISSVKGVSLIIVDTIGNFYRMNVKKDYVKANAILGKQIMILKDLAKNIPILIINQVYSDLKSGLLNPTGGKIVVNNSDVIIRLEKKPRRLIVEKPFSKDMLFEIKKEGIVKI